MKTVLLAAGYGARLWPLSTKERPKQFLPLFNNQSPLIYTFRLFEKIVPTKDIFVQILPEHETILYQQLPNINPKNVLLLPEHRDTLAETFWASKVVSNHDNEPILFKSVDQQILKPAEFISNVQKHIKNSGRQPLINLMCTKQASYSPNSGYLLVVDGRVMSFVEKPTAAQSKILSNLEGTLYRSLFVFIATRQQLNKAADRLPSKQRVPIKNFMSSVNFTDNVQLYKRIPMTDISSTLFKVADNLGVLDVGESDNFIDVGLYPSIYSTNKKDAQQNVVVGRASIENSHSNLIVNTTKQKLRVADLNNFVIVSTPDGSLITPLSNSYYHHKSGPKC